MHWRGMCRLDNFAAIALLSPAECAVLIVQSLDLEPYAMLELT